MRPVEDLIVFCHLRWNFVYQRPQHLLSRFAKAKRVIVFEEPVFDDTRPAHMEVIQAAENLLVARPHTPIREHGFSPEQLPMLQSLLEQLLVDYQVHQCIAWLYTPLALPLAERTPYELMVYDCMDALDAFKNASPLLAEREQDLLAAADVVFTGGPSLFRRLQHRHGNVHCFSSSVDAAHFGNGKEPGAEPYDQASIARPRFGYFGVIDERIDLPLIEALAESRPDYQVVMVGPVVKIDPAALPKRPNIHYLGQKKYEELPDYLRGWDVCLLPFARNESTRYISPTKTLEYMAAEKPIVSTPITDVAEPYGHIVALADTPEQFIAACDAQLQSSAADREMKATLMRRVLSATSWDSTGTKMLDLMEDALQARHRNQVLVDGKSNGPVLPGSLPPVLVIGAGPTGLSAAYHLGDDALLLEKNETIGGWCRSLVQDGFTFDYAGHIMFSNDAYVQQLYKMLLGENVHWQNREAWIYSQETYTRYPFQGALYGLPPQVIKECIVGAIEARYGPLKQPSASPPPSAGSVGIAKVNGNGHPQSYRSTRDGSDCRMGDVKDCCGDGVQEATAPLVRHPMSNGDGHRPPPANFEEFIYNVWGAGIAKHFAVPYNKKLWAVPLQEMETSWLGGRVPLPDLEEMIEGALQPVGKPMGPNARFGYPLRGGFQSLMDGFLPYVKDRLLLGQQVARVSPRSHQVELADGTVLAYEQLVSTMPLPVLIKQMGNEVPEEVQAAAAGLRHVSVRCVHLGIGREKLTEKHWIYYPEQTVFHRIFVQGNASPFCNPPGGFGLTCEITYSPHKPLPCDGEQLIQRCIDDCRAVGIIRSDDPVWTSTQVDMPFAYVVYDHARPKNVAVIRQWLESQDILLAGRYSEWEYYNSDHAFIAGKKAADAVRERRTSAAGNRIRATNPVTA
jgi:UDP-galactopyranose mutase